MLLIQNGCFGLGTTMILAAAFLHYFTQDDAALSGRLFVHPSSVPVFLSLCLCSLNSLSHCVCLCLYLFCASVSVSISLCLCASVCVCCVTSLLRRGDFQVRGVRIFRGRGVTVLGNLQPLLLHPICQRDTDESRFLIPARPPSPSPRRWYSPPPFSVLRPPSSFLLPPKDAFA